MSTRKFVLLFGFIFGSMVNAANGQDLSTYSPLQTRWATPENPSGAAAAGGQANGGRKGRSLVPLGPGASATLAEVHGHSGTVRRIWITLSDLSPVMVRSMRIQFYWDDAPKPAIDAPIGDFFSIPLGQMTRMESALFSSPEGRSFVCVAPMPFHKSMKITVTNESAKPLVAMYYEIAYTLGDQHGADMMYFHAWYHDEYPTKLREDFEILPKVTGHGRFLGTSVGVIADQNKYLHSWWGEGEIKVFTDGDTLFPTLNGTGTEDYIGSGWTMHPFSNLYEGCTLANDKTMQYGFYRLHVPDPIFFNTSARVTIQQIGYGAITPELLRAGSPLNKPGPGAGAPQVGTTGRFERQDYWSSIAYFYLNTPSDNLPGLEPVAVRTKALVDAGAQ